MHYSPEHKELKRMRCEPSLNIIELVQEASSSKLEAKLLSELAQKSVLFNGGAIAEELRERREAFGVVLQGFKLFLVDAYIVRDVEQPQLWEMIGVKQSSISVGRLASLFILLDRHELIVCVIQGFQAAHHR